MPVVFVTICTVLLVVPIVSEPVAVLAGAFITLAGVPVYFLLVRSKPEPVVQLSSEYMSLL